MDLKTIQRLREIKRRLRELRADPGAPGAAAEAQRLRGELTRAAQTPSRWTAPRQESDAASPPPGPRRPEESLAGDPTDGLSEADRAAVATWPSSLRGRLGRSALSSVISGPVDDPNGYGMKNDLTRWSPWRY